MKKLLLLILISSLFSSCLKDDLTFGTDGDSENYVILSGDLNTQTLTKGVRYLLKGQVFVKDTKVLTIEAGSVIFGDKATKGTLIISPGVDGQNVIINFRKSVDRQQELLFQIR